MERFGCRSVWKDCDGFGTPCYRVSVGEYSNQRKGEAEMTSSLVHFFADSASLRYLYEEFVPRDDDIFICTYAKSGTTWMQQIIFQLLFGPTESFTEITEESPWLETCFGHQFLSRNQRYPRIIKTHLRYEHLPSSITENSSCRFFFVEREMKDVVSSYLRHLHGFGVDVTGEALVNAFVAEKVSLGPYADYIRSWNTIATAALGDRLKVMHFEEMRDNLTETVCTVAQHLDLHLTDEDLQQVTLFSSIGYMKKNSHKFNHTEERKLSQEKRPGTSFDQNFAFVGSGTVGSHLSSLSSESVALLDEYKKTQNIS